MAETKQGGRSVGNTGKMILFLTVVCAAGVFFFRNYFNKAAFDYTSVPEEMRLTYRPADFEMRIDEAQALRVLAQPQRYRREFNDLIYDVNMQMLYHVANRMGLSDSLRQQLEPKYRRHHEYLRQMYYEDIIALRDTSDLNAAVWYENDATQAVDILNEVASKYTCFLVNEVIISLLGNRGGTLAVKGKRVDTPCGIALTEALRPMITRLKQQAAINDYARSRGLMKEKIEKTIAELAVVEVTDKKGLTKELKTKVMGYSVSSTEIEITAISILKVGFKLDRLTEVSVDEASKRIVVTLPEPQVLSHEVFPKVENLDIGWLRELSDSDFNKNFNALRVEFRRDAMRSNVMDRAKAEARSLMTTLMEPMVKSIDPSFELVVQFEQELQFPAAISPDPGTYGTPLEGNLQR